MMNLDMIREAEKGLTIAERDMMTHYLVGALSVYVTPEQMRQCVEGARHAILGKGNAGPQLSVEKVA